MTDARAYEPGELQVAGSVQGTLHTQVASSALQAARTAEDAFGTGGEDISEQEFRSWADALLQASLFLPTFQPELLVRVGVTDEVLEGIDVGLKTDFNIIKPDIKLQVWESPDGAQAASVSLGYAHHLNVVSRSFLEYLANTKFSRGDLDVRAMWGWETEYTKLTLGPHVIWSLVSVVSALPAEVVERLPAQIRALDPNQLFQSEWIGYYGASATGMVGYKYAYLALDAGVFWTQFTPTVVGERRDYSGVAASLSLGVSGHVSF